MWDMHRVRNSVILCETNCNFHLDLSWWGLLLGDYRDQRVVEHEGVTIGLSQFWHAKRPTLPRMVPLPFLLAHAYNVPSHNGNILIQQ